MRPGSAQMRRLRGKVVGSALKHQVLQQRESERVALRVPRHPLRVVILMCDVVADPRHPPRHRCYIEVDQVFAGAECHDAIHAAAHRTARLEIKNTDPRSRSGRQPMLRSLERPADLLQQLSLVLLQRLDLPLDLLQIPLGRISKRHARQLIDVLRQCGTGEALRLIASDHDALEEFRSLLGLAAGRLAHPASDRVET